MFAEKLGSIVDKTAKKSYLYQSCNKPPTHGEIMTISPLNVGSIRPIINTSRLTIREVCEDDFDAIHVYGSDPAVWEYTGSGPNTAEATRGFIAKCLAEKDESPRRRWSFVLVRKEDGQIIGGCSVTMENRENRQASIGLILRKDAWHQGYATEGIKAMIKFGFFTLGMHRMWACCDPRNLGSSGAMKKAGMSYEGCMRHDQLLHGTWRDSELYAILNPDEI